MSSQETPLPSGNTPSGNPPLGGCSHQLVNRDSSPLTGTSQLSGQSREQLHEDVKVRALKAEKKISRIEAELAQARDKIDDLEVASELKDEQLRVVLENGGRRSTATEDQKITKLETDPTPAQEENQDLKDLTNALLKDLHTSIALTENHTRLQDSKFESLSSMADQLNTIAKQAKDRTEFVMRDARSAYDRGKLAHKDLLATEKHYLSEAQDLITMQLVVASHVAEDDSSLEKLRKFNATAWSKYGRSMINLGFTALNVDLPVSASHDTDSADIKQVSNSKRGGMPRGKAKAADPRELVGRKIGTPPPPKPEKPSKSPAELEMLRLTDRQTLHCLNP